MLAYFKGNYFSEDFKPTWRDLFYNIPLVIKF
jgi:hypothetical protein